MPTDAPRARTSRIYFVTDMTRANAPKIPLGFMLEATWPSEARWLGLVGRRQLTGAELAATNVLTWPELEKPFDLLSQMFDAGWDAQWGEAAEAAQGLWARSPLIVRTSTVDALLTDATIDTDAAWSTTTSMLDTRLSDLGEQLAPTILTTALTPKPWQSNASGDWRRRRPAQGRRIFEAFAAAA